MHLTDSDIYTITACFRMRTERGQKTPTGDYSCAMLADSMHAVSFLEPFPSLSFLELKHDVVYSE